MAVEIEGLEFQIEAKSENAAKGVDALINSFNKLKAVTKGGAGLNLSLIHISEPTRP